LIVSDFTSKLDFTATITVINFLRMLAFPQLSCQIHALNPYLFNAT